MASCVLDLTGLGKNSNVSWNLIDAASKDKAVSELRNSEFIYNNAETLVLDSTQALTIFYSFAFNNWPSPVSPPETRYVIIDRGNGNLEITDTISFLLSLTIDGQNLDFKTPAKKIGETVFAGFDNNTPVRKNLAPELPCKKGYFGYTGNKVTQQFFEMCFVNRSNPDNSVFTGNQLLTIGDLYYPTFVYAKPIQLETIENVGSVPVFISDNMALKAGLGLSIVDDVDACPPNRITLFSATDALFDNVALNTTELLPVEIKNDGNTELVITDVQPREYSHFTIGDFTVGGDINTPSVLTTSTTGVYKPIKMLPGETKIFQVTYFPKDSAGITHEEKMEYTVKRIGDNFNVTETKLFTILRGTSYKIEVEASDLDFGRVDVNKGTATKTIEIKNTGTVLVTLDSFEIIGKNAGNFKPRPALPQEILPNQSISIPVDYTSDNIFSDEAHNAKVLFKITAIDPKTRTTFLVNETKTWSDLNAFSYRDELDDVIDDVTGTVTGDDNGVYTNKVFSVIRDRTVRIMKKRTFPLWDCVGEKLTNYATGSNGEIRDRYFIPVFSPAVSNNALKHQFDISYGNANGSGSSLVVNGLDLKPSQVMYRKYLLETFGTTTGTGTLPTRFEFRNGVTSDSVYFIQVDRNHFKDMLDPGNFELCLVPLSSSINQLINTGSNVTVDQSSSIVYTLIDDSDDFKQDRTDRSGLSEYYHLVSGSRRDGEYGETTDNSWGLVYPKLGLIVLDGNVLDMSCSFNTVTASIDGDNIRKLFLSISGSGVPTEFRPTTQSFFARSAETALVQTYFCRVNPDEFLYSNNPTYVKSSTNQLKYDFFIKNPKTYITTIGLYNKAGELVAVGKLKKPILKGETDAFVFQVRLRIM